MAAPQWHAIPTLVLVSLYILVITPLALTSKDTASLILAVIFGILIDADHLSIRRIKKILRGEKGPVPGWINWGHTWWFLVAFVGTSFITGIWLPFVSYAIHMLIDGGDRFPREMRWGGSPLPESLHRFYPEWLTYETKINI